MIKRIGFVGMGIMGQPMAENLVKAGFEVAVWNRTRAKAEGVLKAGATWGENPAAVAAKAEVVCINVTDTSDVEAVIFGRHGIVEGNPGDTAGLVVIDFSTISPAATREFAKRLSEYEIEMLDAPVSGGDSGAAAGTLSVMVGGDGKVFERCRPIFDTVGGTVTHVGPIGMGQVCKACNQVLCLLSLLGTCEALALAKREGLDLEKMLAVTTQGAGGSWQLANLGPKVARGDLAPGFMVDLVLKDLRIVGEEAEAKGLPLPGTRLATELMRSAQAMGLGEQGTQALSRVLETLGGFKYPG